MTAAGLVCSSAFAATNVVNFNTATELPFKEIRAAPAEYRYIGRAQGGVIVGYTHTQQPQNSPAEWCYGM